MLLVSTFIVHSLGGMIPLDAMPNWLVFETEQADMCVYGREHQRRSFLITWLILGSGNNKSSNVNHKTMKANTQVKIKQNENINSGKSAC